jgi:hypothetical protein
MMPDIRSALLSVLLLGLTTADAAPQTPAQLGARDAFLVAPTTALPPLILSSEKSQLSLRYGGWIYYANEPIHSNVGISFSTPMFTPGGVAALTAAYIGPACDGCDRWLAGAIELQRPLWHAARIRGTLGGGRNVTNSGSASSIAVTIPSDWQFADVRASLHPGFVLASFSTAHERSHGARPSFGAAISRDVHSFTLSLSCEALLLRGTAPVFGGELAGHRPGR